MEGSCTRPICKIGSDGISVINVARAPLTKRFWIRGLSNAGCRRRVIIITPRSHTPFVEAWPSVCWTGVLSRPTVKSCSSECQSVEQCGGTYYLPAPSTRFRFELPFVARAMKAGKDSVGRQRGGMAFENNIY